MKKILASAICLLSMVAANSAFAVTNTPPAASIDLVGTVSATNPQLTVQLSANVVMQYNPSIAPNLGTWYNISTYHNKGSRTFSSTSNDSKIYYQENTSGAILTLPTTSDSSTIASPWLTL